MALLLLAASTAVRSNGILHTFFFLYEAAVSASQALRNHKIVKADLTGTATDRSSEVRPVQRLLSAITALLKGFACSAVICTPFALFQAYGYQQVCVKGDTPQPWCNNMIPYIYGHVQDRYWNVGFLRYFQLKQIPNFILAAPMIALSVFAISSYAARNPARFFLCHLWLESETRPLSASLRETDKAPLDPENERVGGVGGCETKPAGPLLCENEGKVNSEIGPRHRKPSEPGARSVASGGAIDGSAAGKRFFSPAVLCFAHQLAAMVFIATFIMHVQVATRFLSASPVVYWYAANLHKATAQPNEGDRATGAGQGRAFLSSGRIFWWILGTFTAYGVIGTLLFTNFYPFT